MNALGQTVLSHDGIDRSHLFIFSHVFPSSQQGLSQLIVTCMHFYYTCKLLFTEFSHTIMKRNLLQSCEKCFLK